MLHALLPATMQTIINLQVHTDYKRHKMVSEIHTQYFSKLGYLKEQYCYECAV